MAVNKVIYGDSTVIDITDSTVDAEHLMSGYTAYDASGQKITGAVAFQTIYSGSSDPVAATGSNGDVYIKVVS